MVGWFILVGLVSLVVGLLIGVRWVVWNFNRELKKPGSSLRTMLDSHLDAMEKSDVEQFAMGAELYDHNSGCPKGCGREIARMFRETEKKMGSL